MNFTDPDDGTGTALSSWSALGTGPPVALEAAELLWVDLPFRRPIRTAVGTHRDRPLVLVHLRCRTEDRGVDGWGECAALGDRTYHPEDTSSAFDVLGRLLLPARATRAREAVGAVPGIAGTRDHDAFSRSKVPRLRGFRRAVFMSEVVRLTCNAIMLTDG